MSQVNMKLLEPITIKGVEFKNRMVMPPMSVGVAPLWVGEEWEPTRALAYHLERAKGGAGTIITHGHSIGLFVSDYTWGRARGVQDFTDTLPPFTEAIRQTGARIGVQLWFSGRLPVTMNRFDQRGELVAPSATAVARELTVPEINEIIYTFGQAAAVARRVGFDFVEIHGAHGYVPHQFVSPATNHRHDDYGGDLTRRMRFGLECVRAVRAAVGEDFLIFYRMGGMDTIPSGETLYESTQFAAALEKAGVDVIDVSHGMGGGGGGPEQPEGTLVPWAEAIKRRVTVPVIAVGRFRTPQVAEEVLVQGKADMIAIGRQLIADPDWPEKATTGRSEDIRPCISCGSCNEWLGGLVGPVLKCSVNAVATVESELIIEPAPRPKKVMVVGGGPAGMEAARVAAQRGHKVTLYEKESELGGLLIPAAVPPYKQELALLNRYLARQLEKSAVKVKLGVEVTPKLVEKERPDAVILAVGSTPMIPEIPGISSNKVVAAVDVLLGKVNVGEKVVVIGGELVGCETADFLSQQGKEVTVVRRGAEMAAKMFTGNRNALLTRLKEKGVELVMGVIKYEAVTEEGLVIIDSKGKRRTLEADTIVLAAGSIPNNQMARALEGKVSEIYLAGDCAQPRRILEAIHEGARLGREV